MEAKPAPKLAIVALGLLLLGAPGRASAHDGDQAQAFVLHLYAAYHGAGPDYLGRGASKVFSPRMVALLQRDRARTPRGYVGALDGDPICDCQDFEISRIRASVMPGGPGRVKAVARFVNLGSSETVRLDLVSIDGAWRIDNIHTANIPDLRAFLRKHAGGR